MLKRSRPPARKEKAHSRVESAACCWVGVGTQKNPPPEGEGLICRGRLYGFLEATITVYCPKDKHRVDTVILK